VITLDKPSGAALTSTLVACVSVAPTMPSRVFAIARPPAARTLAALAGTDRDIVVLEGLAIVGNVGAILRTAAAERGPTRRAVAASGLGEPEPTRPVRRTRVSGWALRMRLGDRDSNHAARLSASN